MEPGAPCPTVITYYVDKSFSMDIKTPPASVLILQAANKKKGSDQPNLNKVASITWDQVKDIAETKMKDLNSFKISSAMKMIAGTARSMGVRVKGTFPENLN